MIISSDLKNELIIRNRLNLSIFKTVYHFFGFLSCGICYPNELIVFLGINYYLVEFDYEKMEIRKYRNYEDFRDFYHIEKVNDDIFLTGGYVGDIKLIRKTDLTILSHLKI